MLLPELESSRHYSVQDFLRIARTQLGAAVSACDLYYIPSRSSCYHEFLLVEFVDAETAERLILVVERAPANNGTQVISSSGGVAKDTITIVRTREFHEYWQRAGQEPVCKGTLRWNHPSPSLLDVAFIAGVASTTFKHYNLYIRQCYWYARITLDAIATAFPSCSKEGTTSFSRKWFSMFGSYKQSHVQFLVELHTIGCRDLHQPVLETERHASYLIAPDILHDLAASIANLRRSLALFTIRQPEADIGIRYSDRTAGGMPESSQYVESH
ncbi:hypothetical protein F5J12DRAFT_322815 [Pisolithus orientalis]|uniref:uncharacterized protein n=1 Tax=Pisolithus orientalis TaxID=936130 RepID=UPI0022250B5A|nr:uncharacterized protein F5J12DRAFT_322815 [Pisolithus orientalis]KAI5998327.1 hypothetical protein F5J12DRAFT_322815 [Pisolithus orientalis]